MLGHMVNDSYGEEEEGGQDGKQGWSVRKEFDCPSCNANNPLDDAIKDGDELLCNYCGSEYKAKITEEGRLKLKEF